jgi:magnesium transporter
MKRRSDETAGRIMTRRFLWATGQDHVDDVRRRLHRMEDGTGMLFVTDEQGRLKTAVDLGTIMKSPGHAVIAELPGQTMKSVELKLDQEAVAAFAFRNRQAVVPVTDEAGRLVGIVPPLAIIDTLQHEHDEDTHRLAGIRHRRDSSRKALELPVLLKAWNRLPWLLAGLAGCLASALLIAGYEDNIRAQVAIAFFLPAIVYIADAIGTQTEAIVVRGLAHGHLPLASIFASETSAGFLIGAALGSVALLGVIVLFGQTTLAIAVALSIVSAGAVASAVGLLLPWLLSSQGLDPAYGSGPIATIIQDVLSVIVYFAIVNALV